ncbi:MAG: MBL fold metallo-hydrolase, partial [Alistipes sp.]|nr:MBL fold metallo-hydrolase [Alistipes sp.]
MKTAALTFNPIQENTYVLWDETLEAAIVDAGNSSGRENAALDDFLAQHGLRPVAAINTHGHFDHTLGVCHLKERYGIPFALSKKDEFLLENAQTSGSI